MIRTCLFDMGNVLFHFSHEKMCCQLGALCDCSGEDVRCLLFADGLQLDFECGRFTEEEFHARFEQELRATVSIEALRHACCDIFELNAPIVPVIDALRRGGTRLVLLSNTSVTHFDYLSGAYDLLGRFDDFVVSYQAGAIKPDAAIFEAALAKIDCEPGECFYTDDIPGYVEAARAFGLQSEVYVDVPTLIEQLRQRGLSIAKSVN